MTFYGHRNRWSSYFLSGFFALALICVSIILKVGVESAVNPPSKAIRGLFLVAAVIAGAVGGAISIVFWRGAGLLACGLGGFFFGLFLQALRPGGLIRPVGLRFILYFGLYAIFFTVSCNGRAHSLVLALATAIIGATALTLGIDCYSTQGLKEFYVRNLGFDSLFQNKYPPTFQNGRFPLVQGMQIELGVLGALILMGFAFQMRLWSDIRTQLAALKRSDERRNMRSKAERAARAVARTAKRDLAEWEARHGYNKTASRNIAGKDEENGVQSAPSADLKDNRSRTSSFMTLFRANTDGTQLLMPLSPTEKIAHSPAASSVLDNNAYPFPAQTASRHSANFLEYIQKGPEPVEAEGPLRLDLPSLTSALDLGPSHPATAASEAIPMSPVHSVKMGDMPRSTSLFASQQQPSVDPTRSAPSETITGVGSFRQRSASTAALMDNSASFMDIAPVQKEPSNPPSLSSSALVSETGQFNNADRRTQSLSLTTASALGTDTVRSNQSPAFGSHERTFSNPMAPTASSLAGAAPMTKSSSHQDQLRSYSPAVYAQPYPEAHAEPRVTQVPQQTSLPSPDFGAVKTITGGQSNAVMQARRSLASRRSDQAAVPWTNPGAENAAAAHQRTRSADAQSRMRAMSIEELEARHRAKLTAMQAPATQTVQEAEALRRAKDEWERKQKIERRRMQEREAQKAAAAATAAAARPTMSGSASNGRVASPVQGSFDLARASSPSVRDERRRSRNLSATLLEAVGEEGREGGGANRAAQWRQSISGVEQLDPRASRASNPGTPTSTRPTSPQPTSALERATPTPSPFPAQPPEARKRLSETDRRRLSQGAGRNSQPLLNFNLPTRG
ncbi:hypothetical protein PHSY_004305 [Pseudozyma hubeiensis SY62]|uniref:TM7S3/TM198-like domain-containing protein n=1 Tax=Pseudozyma hubeiensis (strain SY62) TaxID=1305764 RepID=R9P5U4_PSEHS|nr:hypothetical protein PHSY_004305 [Pseudozyma hubeiensis SY62]GAC96721.1 hypothetical protein PHSY_004305 [Pseudozyma hubeiensis SY62]